MKKLNNPTENFVSRRINQRRVRRWVALLSALVLFLTVNTLKLEADTLERIATCGIEQHVHDESCYDASGALICGLAEHAHTDACFQQRPQRHDLTRVDGFMPLNAKVTLATPMPKLTSNSADGQDAVQAEADYYSDIPTEVGSGIEPPVDEIETELAGEDAAPAVEDAVPLEIVYEDQAEETVQQPEYVINGSTVLLSDILSVLGMKASGIHSAGELEGDTFAEDPVNFAVEATQNDYELRVLRDFDAAELGVVTADEVIVITLKNGIAPVEDSDDENPSENDDINIEETHTEETDEEVAADETVDEEAEDSADELTENADDEETGEASDEATVDETEEEAVETVEETETAAVTPEKQIALDFADYDCLADATVYFYASDRAAVLVNAEELAEADGVHLTVNAPVVLSMEANLGLAELEAALEEAPEDIDARIGENPVLFENGVLIISGDGELTVNGVTYTVTNLTLPARSVESDNITISTVDDQATLLGVTPAFEDNGEDEGDIYALFAARMDEHIVTATSEEIQIDAIKPAKGLLRSSAMMATTDAAPEAEEAVADAEETAGTETTEAAVETRTLRVRVYDVSLIREGESVEPDAPIHVETTFDAPLEGENFQLYHIVDGKPEEVDGFVKTDDQGRAIGMSFDTASLSPFAVVYYTVEYEIVNGEVTVKVDFTDIVQNGVDFDENDVISALNDGVGVNIAELEQGYTEGTDNVVYGELSVDYTTADNKDSLVQKSWGLMDVVSADDGLTVENGEIRVTADGTVVLSDGETTINIVITGYQASVQKVLGDGATIEALGDTELPMGASAAYEDISDRAEALAEAYDLIPEASEDKKQEIGFSAFDVAVTVPSGEYDAEGSFAVTVSHEVEIPEGAKVELFHIHEVDGVMTADKVEDATVEDGRVSFVTDGFSEYVVRYTVDFEYNGRLFSIYGDSAYPLADVLAMLGLDVPNDTIAGAEFTRRSVLSISRDENGVWWLNSHGAFTTQEKLTVTTTDGAVYEINVADAAQTYNGVKYGDLAELSNNITVDVNGTNLKNEQARDKTLNLTFNYSMLFGNATAARAYHDGGTYNWVYDLSAMAAQYPEIAEFPNMTGTLRSGRTVLGTYEVKDNKVYLHVNEAVLGDSSTRINGSFTINMVLDANGTGSEDSTTFSFPGGGSFTIKYKPVQYNPGQKSANPTDMVVYPDQYDNGYVFVDYTAEMEQQYDLKSLVFEDVLSPHQELIASSVKINGQSASVTSSTDSTTGQTTFSFNALDALGVSKLPANTKATVTYTVRVPKADIEAAEAAGLKLFNDAGWKIGETNVPGGDTEVKITEKPYSNPEKVIKSESSTQGGGAVVNPNGETKAVEGVGDAVKATLAMQNADGTYHISYAVRFNEGGVPKNMSLTDEYNNGQHQTLLTDTFTVTVNNGQKYAIPASYIQDNGGTFTIPDVKAAILAATGSDFAANTNYSINYETSVTAADFDAKILNSAKLTMDKDYPTDETEIILTSEDFQPGTKRNASEKLVKLANGTDPKSTDWEITITEPKKANVKAVLTDTYDGNLSLVDGSFQLVIGGNTYDVPDSFVDKSQSQHFTIDYNALLTYLKNNKGYTGQPYVDAGVRYVLKYKTTTNVANVFSDLDQYGGQKTLNNEADWVFSDDSQTDVPMDGGKDDVTYIIPDYIPTTKSDTVTGNVARANGKYGDASYYITGDGPYTINYTITVPAQERDLTSAVLTDAFTTNQTIDWSSFKVNGAAVSRGLTHPTYTESDPENGSATTNESFTLNLMEALGEETLKAGTAVTITYTATTNVLDEKITNDATWVFDGDHNDGPHHTEEKIVKPEYQPGNKSVNNPNAGKEVPIKNDDDTWAEYTFDWTLTITEPTELTKAVLHDDYGTDSKAHTLVFPITVTAGGETRTIASESDTAIKNWNATDKTFDIDMIALFGVAKFPANTTFKVQYQTKTTGDTIIQDGVYHNQGTWDFDGTIGPKDNVPGGEAETTLKTTEYNDGTKVPYYNGQRLYGGSFIVDGGTIVEYVASIEQDHDVTTLTYYDDWGDSRLILLYPITVEDSDGNVVATYADATEAQAADTHFGLTLVNNGKLPNGSDFETGVTYFVKYKLDFKDMVGEDGEFDANIVNHGHWHTDGKLPPHDDEHDPDIDPKYPDWLPITKDVTDVRYSNASASPAIVEDQLDKADGNIWWTDAYTKVSDPADNGTFYIFYDVTMKEPRELTALTVKDVTNIPFAYGDFPADARNKLEILNENGEVATWAELGVPSPTLASFDNVPLTKEQMTGEKLGFNFDVMAFLNTQLSPSGEQEVKIPKNYTVKLSFIAQMNSAMDDNGYERVNTSDFWHNDITATFNEVHPETDDADVKIKTRMTMEKTATAAEAIGNDIAPDDSVDGVNLGTDGQGKRVKYTITVGKAGDTFTSAYELTDALTNILVQRLDEDYGVHVTYGDASTDTYTDGSYTTFYYNNGSISGVNYPNGFWLKIPAGKTGPVVIDYYVTNITQDDADALNGDSDSSNDVWGAQTETNTVRNQEDKEITTTYEVEYQSDHEIQKDFTKWEKDKGTATWKVVVKAENTHRFPAGYRITEEAFVYTDNADAANWETDDWKTNIEGGNTQSMTLDLSKIIVTAKRYNNIVLKLGVDYEIVGNSIVFLKDVGEWDQDGYYADEVRVTGIRTTIPGYNEETLEKYYYYNDASIRTDHDSLLDEDDDKNDTDARALLEKKYAGYELVGDTPYWTWQVIITPPRDGLAGWKWQEKIDSAISSKAFGVKYGNNQYYDTLMDSYFTMVTDKGVELDNTFYTLNGNDFVNNPITFTDKINTVTDRIIITIKTKGASWSSSSILAEDTYTAFNYTTLTDTEGDTNTANAEKEFSNTDLDVTKSVGDTGGTLEDNGIVYPTIECVGDNIYEYTIVVNPTHRDIKGEVKLVDLLPLGFELVDYNGTANGAESIWGYTYYDTDLDVKYIGPRYFEGNSQSALAQDSETWMQPVYEIDPVTGKKTLPIDPVTGRYKLMIDKMSAQGNGSCRAMTVKYKVKLTDAEKARLGSLTTGAIQYYENVVTAYTDTRTGTATETVVYQYDEALKKEDVTDPMEASVGEITYEVYVNNDPGETAGTFSPRTLNGGEPLELSDTINTSLELNRQNIKVYKDTGNNGTWEEVPVVKPTETEDIKNGNGYSLTYNSDSRVLAFKLADATHFKIVIPCFAEDVTEDIDGDGEISDAEAHNGWYKNTVTLVGEGRFNDEVDEDHKVYTAGGEVENLGGTGFSIDKYDEYDITKPMEGAMFQLYKVAEFSKEVTGNDWPTSFVIPERSSWEKVGDPKTTDSTGIVSWNNLEYTIPDDKYPSDMYDEELRDKDTSWTKGIGTTSETNGTHVTLYAWEEVGLSSELIQEGYTIGDNAKPHYIILYYTAKSRETIAHELFAADKIATDPSTLTWTKKGSECSPALPAEDAAKVEAEYIREQQKALSSYNITSSFDHFYEDANFITISSSKDGYKWPVPNTDLVKKTVTKLWDDYRNVKGVRPKAWEVKVQLFQNGVKYGDEVTLKDTTISASNAQYYYTWENLPATDSSGNDYVYTVEEVDVNENYTATYSDDTFTITNHLVDPSTVTATKLWEDDNNRERKRPQSIFYQLYQMDDNNPSAPAVAFGNEVEAIQTGLQTGWTWTGNSAVTVTGSSGYTVKWANLPQVDDPDEPTTTYSYFVIETKLKAQDGTLYFLDDETNKFYAHEGNVESDAKTGDPLYSSEVTDENNIYTVTNTVVSSKYGSLLLEKELKGLVGNHSEIDVDGDEATPLKADAKPYYFKLINDEFYAIKATLNTDKSTDTLKVYDYTGVQQSEDDYTAFEFSELVKVQVDGLPMGNYIAQEITSGKKFTTDTDPVDMTIKGYEYDVRVNGESVPTVLVTPTENTPSDSEPQGVPPVELESAEIINNYIPDKGSIELTKKVTGLPEGTNLAAYRFPVVITVQNVSPAQYVATDGSLSDTRIVHWVTPGTPYTVGNVPIGKYDVAELTEDAARMPDVTEGATYDANEKPDGVTGDALAHYSLVADGSTTQLQGLLVTKNGTRKGELVNNYIPKGNVLVNKTILNNGMGDPTDIGKTFKIGVFSDEEGTQMVGEAKTLTIRAGTGAFAGQYVGSTSFTGLPYGTYYVYELDDEDHAIIGAEATINDVNYIVTGENEAEIGQETAVVNLENDQKPQETSLTVEKSWTDLADTVSYTITYKVQQSVDSGVTWSDYDADGDGTAETYTMTYTAPVAPATEGTVTGNLVEHLPPEVKYRAVETDYTVIVAGGDNITRTVTVEGTSVEDDDAWKSTITNTLPTIDIPVKKAWGGTATPIEGDYVKFKLYNGQDAVKQPGVTPEADYELTISYIPADETNGIEGHWPDTAVTFAGLPEFDDQGSPITYTIVETEAKLNGTVVNDSATIKTIFGVQDVDVIGDNITATTFTNTPAVLELVVNKSWQNFTLPEGYKLRVTYNVYQGTLNEGTVTDEVIYGAAKAVVYMRDTTADDGTVKAVPAAWENLPRYNADGTVEYRYRAVEAKVELMPDTVEDTANPTTEGIVDITEIFTSEAGEATLGTGADASKLTQALTNTQKKKDFEADKSWLNGDGTDLPPEDGTEIVFKLSRFKDGATEADEVTFADIKLNGKQDMPDDTDQAALTENQETLTASTNAVNAKEGTPWKANWTGLDKYYWDSTVNAFKEYTYKVTETSVKWGSAETAQNVVNGSTVDGRFLVTYDDAKDSVTNTLNEKSVEFGKQWKNASLIPVEWVKVSDEPSADNAAITITLSRRRTGDSGVVTDDAFTRTFSIKPGDTTMISVAEAGKDQVTYNLTWTIPDAPEDVPGANDYIYKFTISGLEKYYNGDSESEWTYSITEAASTVNGKTYTPGYSVNTSSADEAETTQYIINQELNPVSLPSTGGPGTTVFNVLGSILTLLAAVLLITKKRSDATGIE